MMAHLIESGKLDAVDDVKEAEKLLIELDQKGEDEMNFEFLSRVWTAFGPAIVNYEKVDAVCGAAALLTLAFQQIEPGTQCIGVVDRRRR